MLNTQSKDADRAHGGDPQSGPSWRAMLWILAVAILAAVAVAYLLIAPFFHQHPR